MARVSYLVLAFLLALATSVRSQFFADIFQGFQPFVTTRPTKQIYEQTTKSKNYQNRGNYRHTTKTETTKPYENDGNIYPPIVENETDRRKTVNYVHTTTVKPKKMKESSRRIGNKRDQATEPDFNNINYDGKINSISYTEKPSYSDTDFNRNNYYTTHNPLFNGPGVKPAVIDNRPPITNRPVTKRPNYGNNPRPKDEDAIDFPSDDTGPEIIIGPDEDYMSAVEKKRYLELAERMCDKYKSLTTKAVQAIPLLPFPEPVSLNVTQCTPTTVPLVVGGKVVRVEEFPHMAMLGWRKLQGPGYSWKCGGSLVSDQFILTAAHCTYQDRDNTVVTGPPTAVQLGSSYLNDPGALVVKVAAVIRHPKYKQPKSYYDLALVKMVNAVKFSEMIKPACLGVPPSAGKSIIATGWGRTEFGGDQSHELRSVSLPVWGMPRCQEVLGTSRKLPDGPNASQVCAGEERGGKDTCQGDSGGPAQIQEGCIWRVVAVTSLGRSCGAAETPGLYAKVQRAFVASQVFGKSWNDASYGDKYGNDGGNNRDKYDENNGQSGSNSNVNNYGNNNGQNSQNFGANNRNKYDDNNGQNNQNFGSNNRDKYGNGNGGSYGNNNGQNSQNFGANNREKYGNSNVDGYGNNNGNSGSNNRDTYGNNGGSYGNDNGEGSQNHGNNNRDGYGNNNGQNSQSNGYNNRDKYGNNNADNYGSNNRETGNSNSQNYGNTNTNSQYGNKNRPSYGSQFSNNGQSYDANNQNYGEKPSTERPSFNRQQYTTVRTENNYNDNYGSASNSNYGNNNKQTNYNQESQNSYTTQRRYDTTTRSNNYYNDFTTTRRTTGNGNRGTSNYSNNYNTQNVDNNNRRPSETYTISRPWWL